MKTKIYIILLTFWLGGCSDFLKESSQDEIRPSTVADLDQLLLGEGYLIDYNIYNLTDILTDNMKCNGVAHSSMQSYFDARKWCFRWEENMFASSGGGNNENFWEIPYKGIAGCNLVLDNLDKMYGEENERESLRGEALALRGWLYFHLVNFFGFPYNYGDSNENLGVPLKLDADVTDEYFTRNTVAEVYRQIEKDLLEANRLLTIYDMERRDYFRIGDLAAKAMLSRMYLYMEDWDKALAYADSVLLVKSELLNLDELPVPNLYSEHSFHSVYSPLNPVEIIWGREYHQTNLGSHMSYKYPYSVSDELVALMESSFMDFDADVLKDLRGGFFFSWSSVMVGMEYDDYQIGTVKDDWYGKYQGIRTAELYLNRAEAYARKYKKDGTEEFRTRALADLNELRRHRLNNNVYPFEEVSMANADDLIDFCLLERRKELSGETNHRWFDLRRTGMPEIKHYFFTDVSENPVEYKLTTKAYVLPIPERAMNLNPNLVQNSR
ncbi:RagB/SusD family nutrient uptake outer membrane protein [Butyricimonas hominis]|uniref:RagB/SusD family nutrient uptake outer membrane protein n=1 Tax=Butyricimonas TaxID=574697 RepID=UPI0035198C81